MSVSPRYPTALTPPFPTRRSSVLVLAHIIAANPAHAAQDADVVITCVGNDDDLADVVLGPNGVFRMLKKGGVFIDHTTVSARIARQISVEARDLQVHCVDAPMTGRSEEHTSELQSLMRISYAVFCLKKKKKEIQPNSSNIPTDIKSHNIN